MENGAQTQFKSFFSPQQRKVTEVFMKFVIVEMFSFSQIIDLKNVNWFANSDSTVDGLRFDIVEKQQV